jgi:hypothetical protein
MDLSTSTLHTSPYSKYKKEGSGTAGTDGSDALTKSCSHHGVELRLIKHSHHQPLRLAGVRLTLGRLLCVLAVFQVVVSILNSPCQPRNTPLHAVTFVPTVDKNITPS